MSLESDLIIDRRRLKRRLSFWRILAVLAVAATVLLAIKPAGIAIGPHIARVRIDGLITEDRKLTEQIAAAAKDDSVKAMIVAVDSPGGAVAGGESLHDAIARVAAAKPVVAVMGGMAASAGYMVSVPATRIFARNGTLTGSIGVLLETGDVSALLSRIGVDTDLIVSGPLKGQPSFIKPLSPQGREVLQGLVANLFEQFVAMVADGRHMPVDKVRALADGRAYTGQQALGLGLIDQIGGETEARAWLAKEKGIPESLPVHDLPTETLAERALGEGAGSVFFGWMKTLLFQGVKLDGAWAVWQPQAD